MREALESAGMDRRFISGHSFRIGAATVAAKGGTDQGPRPVEEPGI